MSFLLPLTGPPAHGAHHHVLVPGPLHAVGAAAARWGPGTAGTRRPGSGGELASMSLCCLCLFCFVLFCLVDGFFGMGSTSSGLDEAGVMGRLQTVQRARSRRTWVLLPPDGDLVQLGTVAP